MLNLVGPPILMGRWTQGGACQSMQYHLQDDSGLLKFGADEIDVSTVPEGTVNLPLVLLLPRTFRNITCFLLWIRSVKRLEYAEAAGDFTKCLALDVHVR